MKIKRSNDFDIKKYGESDRLYKNIGIIYNSFYIYFLRKELYGVKQREKYLVTYLSTLENHRFRLSFMIFGAFFPPFRIVIFFLGRFSANNAALILISRHVLFSEQFSFGKTRR